MVLNTMDLKPGFRVRLIGFGQTDALYRRKLLSFGVTRGVELDVVRVAPLGCPIQVDVRGASLALRKEEACYLQWERL
jgi:ferrous iron transport protein A